MAVFNLKKLNAGAWFDYGEDARVLIRPHDQSAIDAIRKECTKEKVEYKRMGRGGRLQRIEYMDTDDKKIRDMIHDYCILDWEGFVDDAGGKIECTTDNKILLMNGSPEFYNFVDEALETMLSDRDKEVKGAEKN